MRPGRRGKRWKEIGRGANDEVARKKRERYGNYERVCEKCGKKFLGRYNAKYCSRKCARTGNSNPNTSDTLCCTCKHATNAYYICPWSAHGEPVPGWKAKATKLTAVKGKQKTNVESYIGKKCPLYEEG